MDVKKRVITVVFGYIVVACCVFFSSGNAKNHNASSSQHGSYLEGKQIWNSHQCSICHSIFGLGGHLGPDLTNVSSRQDDIYIRNIIRTGVKKMPSYDLSDEEMSALYDYFYYLNTLGTYPGKSVKEDYFG